MIAATTLQPILDRAGVGVLRHSLVLIFLGYVLLKSMSVEAATIAPPTEKPVPPLANPLVGSSVGSSALAGVVEIATALFTALRRPWSHSSALGRLMAALAPLRYTQLLRHDARS